MPAFYTIDSDRIPSQNKANSKLQILKIYMVSHLLKLLDKVQKYWMDLANIVEDTEWTRFRPQTDGRWTDRWTDMVKPLYPPFKFAEAGA